MGSAISLLPTSQCGEDFCFRVLSGVTGVILQANSRDDQLDWVKTFKHYLCVQPIIDI